MNRVIVLIVTITVTLFTGALVTPSLAAESAVASESGTVAAIEGSLTVQRAGSTAALALGSGLVVGDRLRTGPGDRAKLVFLDDSVIDMAPSSEIVLQTQSFDPVADRYEATVQLVNGKIRVALGDKYRQGDNRFEVETPTAVAVRGTEYIVLFNSGAQTTEVISVSGQVDVLGRLAVVGAGVQVGTGTRTEITRGKYPSARTAVGPDRMRQYLSGLNIVGTGRRDGLNVLHPVVNGKLLAAQDIPGVKPGASRLDGKLRVGAPRESLAEELSADVRTNTQPLLEYRRLQPGLPLPANSGGVHVDF